MHVLYLSFRGESIDPRRRRLTAMLKSIGHSVSTIAPFGDSVDLARRSILARIRLFMTKDHDMRARRTFWRQRDEVLEAVRNADVVILADVEFLPFLPEIKSTNPKGKIVVDLYENYCDSKSLSSNAASFYYWLFRSSISNLNRLADLVICPEARTREIYKEVLTQKVLVVRNARSSKDFVYHSAVSPEPLRLVHHGFLFSNRGINLYTRALRLTERTAVLTIYTPSALWRRLGLLIRNFDLVLGGRFRVIDAVKYEQLPIVLSRYDLGLCVITGDDLNARLALPNKFFDYVAAGIPFIAGPGVTLVESAKILGQLGLETTSAQELANVFDSLSSEVLSAHRRDLEKSRHVFSIETDFQEVADWLSKCDSDRGGC